LIEFRGRAIPETLEEILDPSHTVLDIQDMQNNPCNPESEQSKRLGGHFNCDRIVGTLLKLRESARKAGVKVMYTQSTAQPNYQNVSDIAIWKSYTSKTPDFADPKNPLPQTGNPFTWGWEIIDELKPLPTEVRIMKHRSDPFVGTNFESVLKNNRIRTIIPCGVALEIGIDAVARTATFLDYFVVIPRDAVSGMKEDYMKDAMKWLERSVIVTSSSEIMKIWEKKSN
jgi:nicotinamidase-related amidase